MDILFHHVAILGLGQMGASLGLALRRGGLVGHLAGYDAHAEHAQTALRIGAVDALCESAAAACAGADLVVLCTPVGSYSDIMQSIAPALAEDCTLTDIGSIKAQAIRDIMPHLPAHVRFVPSHPIAGSEKIGPYHAHGEFFARKLFLITPIDGTPPEWLEPMAKLWHSTGAAIDLLPPDLHDQIYAYMSHLPQLIAFAAMPVLASQPLVLREDDALFRRFIRIGRSDPHMWRDVFLENDGFMLTAAGNLRAVIEHMRDELLLGGASAAKADKADPLAIPVELICKTLWPRMLASAMITVVQIAEDQLKLRLPRYAAGGFTDVSCPVVESSDDDFTAISQHPTYAIALLSSYLEQQKHITDAIEAHDSAALMSVLEECQSAGKRLIEML